MAETTGISWTDSTFNGWIGCDRVSPGCDNCYAAVSTPARVFRIVWGPKEPRHLTSDSNWDEPRRWERGHAAFFQQHGRRRRVFCSSLSDVFDRHANPEWRERLWKLIRETPNLDWLILTKRIGNAPAMLPSDWGDGYKNVWLGISVVNKEEFERDVPKLRNVPAALRWLSMEPLLGPVSFGEAANEAWFGIDWVVVGGESGSKARPMLAWWVDAIREECASLGVPFFFKQWGGGDAEKGGCLLAGLEQKSYPVRLAA